MMMKREMKVSVHDHIHLLVPQKTEEDVEEIEPSFHETKMSLMMMGMIEHAAVVVTKHEDDESLMKKDQNHQVLQKKEPY